MSQTLFAILALVMITGYTMNANKTALHMQRNVIGREIEEMAASVGLESIEIIRSRPYDQAVNNGNATGSADDVDYFSWNNSTDHFSTGKACSVFKTGTINCDDVDDFHKMQTATWPFAMGQDTIWFTVDVEVEYVDVYSSTDIQRANERTFHKQVKVYVQDVWDTGAEPYIPQPIYFSRVVSHDF